MLNFYDFVKEHPVEIRQFSCKDLLFLINECPPDFTKAEDWAQHNVFLYVTTGRHNLSSRERTWHLDTGSTVFVKKGALGIERMDEQSFCALMFYVPDEYIRSFIRENKAVLPPVDLSIISSDKILTVHTTTVMTAFYESVLPYFSLTTKPPEKLIELKFGELLLNIISNRDNRELTAYFYRLALTDVDDLKDIMESNCLYNLQLHEYARLCHRSLSSFKRDFNTAYGMAPGRWLLEKRLEAATRLLVSSEKPVMDVAIESGFKNISHFDRVFKQHYNASPLQYRKLHLPVHASVA
jgi:AraC-like DNA-binding protein